MISHQSKPPLISAEELFSQKIYWLNQLAGEIPETNFCPDYVRPMLSNGDKKNLPLELPSDLSLRIIQLTNGSHLSIFILLVAVLKILLQKYTSNHDIIVGSPIYNPAQDEELSNKVIPLRSHVVNQLAFSDFLRQVQDTVIGAYSHQNYPLDELVDWLKIPVCQNRCPIFDIVILLENLHNYDCLLDSKNDLTFAFIVNDNSVQGNIEYNSFLFRDESIKTIAKYYVNLLESVLHNSSQIISEISLLTETDKQQLLTVFNENTKNYPVTKTIHQLFEEQVKRTINKMAAVDAKTNVTYQKLNEKANQLARLLQKLGVKPGDFVGILKPRDVNFLIAILAILKVGGVYVPMDSTYPPERISYMVSHSEVRILLTDSCCVNLWAELQGNCPQLQYLICLDNQLHNPGWNVDSTVKVYTSVEFENLPRENLNLNIPGFAPAYMIYTSGSTGLPKGAIIRHGGAINHIYAQFDALHLSEDFTFLQSAPASSDISVWQFLAPILIGGKTVIVDTETVCHPQKLFQVIKEQKITIVEFVPVVLTGLLDYISHLKTEEKLLPDLKWMMVTGESASVALVNQWLHIYPSIKVVNAYGPSEAADDITQFIVDKPLPENQRTVPIGKPLANLNLYILDAQLQLVPLGAPGEICVSGFGVGQGYWQNEVSTQRSFVPNPFVSTAKPLPGTDTDLVYKTGDLGRWLPDGNIEFLGRIDYQVKIRGFRIELGEIEAILAQHPGVGEAVVVLREDSPGDKRLVAYVVTTEYGEITPQLRQFLQQRLPEYMVPSAFVLMESLPLTPSGKVDRQGLPVPDRLKSGEVSFVVPRTPTEAVVAEIWTQVLGIKQVGIHDNFFDLGGHSLLATQVISRSREALQVELPLRSLFEQPTVAQLGAQIDKMLTAQQLQSLPMVADEREEIEL